MDSLGGSVLPWASEGRPLRVDLEAPDRARDCVRENRVVVVELPRRSSEGQVFGLERAELVEEGAAGGLVAG